MGAQQIELIACTLVWTGRASRPSGAAIQITQRSLSSRSRSARRSNFGCHLMSSAESNPLKSAELINRPSVASTILKPPPSS